MSRLTVLLDVDGVSADFVGATLRTLSALGGPVLTDEDIVNWDLMSFVPEEFHDNVHASWRERGWCRDIEPYPGGPEFVWSLAESHRVMFVTSPLSGAPHWYSDRVAWLKAHAGCTERDIIFADRKDLVRGDVLVDDRPEHIESWSAANPDGLAILLDRPWNRSASVDAPNVVRAHTYEDIVSTIKSIAQLYNEDFEVAERASAAMSAAVKKDRHRLGLRPHEGGRQPDTRPPCGCAEPEVAVGEDGTAYCARCSSG